MLSATSGVPIPLNADEVDMLRSDTRPSKSWRLQPFTRANASQTNEMDSTGELQVNWGEHSLLASKSFLETVPANVSVAAVALSVLHE